MLRDFGNSVSTICGTYDSRDGHETLKPETEAKPRSSPAENETLASPVETRLR